MGGEEDLNQQSRTGKLAVYLFLYIPVVWAALLLAQSLGGGLPEIITNLTAAMEHPFRIQWTDHSLVTILVCTGAYIMGICLYADQQGRTRDGEEHGSAAWASPRQVNAMFAQKQNKLLTKNVRLGLDTHKHRRSLNVLVIGGSGAGKSRTYVKPNILEANTNYVITDPKGGMLSQVGYFLQKKKGYKIKVFNSIDFSKSMHYNPLAYIKNEADILKFVNALISNTKGEGKEGDPFWTKSETLLYCALITYIIFEGPAEDRNMNTLVDMISGMEVKEDDPDFMNAVDYMFAGLEKRKPDCFAVKQYRKYRLASGEDYLEAVLILGQRMKQVRAIDVAQYLGYAKTSVSHGLRLLRQGGFLTRDADGYLYLTEIGQETAEKIYAKHRFFTQWLIEAGVAPDSAEKDACRMEHAISEESFHKLMQALEHPQKPPLRGIGG